VYEISKSQWTKQATDGPTPKYRVNACAALASAADGSSHNIYFFGGQNLIPYGEQKQLDDSWILTIPSFTWIQIDTKGQSVPPARAGHSCEMYGGNMVVVGGYVGQELSCDSPGIYVFNASGAQWTKGFVASSSKTGPNNNAPNNIVRGRAAYKVPPAVFNIVGGGPNGGATVTRPARTPDADSPVATGKPGDYQYTTLSPYPSPTLSTITNADGTLATITTTPKSSGPNSPSSPNIGAIVGGAIGGIACLVILILLGAYIWYRRKIRQLRESKMAESRQRSRPTGDPGSGTLGTEHSDESATELLGQEPTFIGVLLNPRRSLRVVNH
jgi:hypothetical protein